MSTKETGNIGEDIAVTHLQTMGFKILDRNYRKKWGELDIVAQKQNSVHFIEVKTVSYETKGELVQAISRGTWRPEEQVHQFKIHQIAKVLETWISEHNYEDDWVIDVVGVRIVPRETFATVNFIENITP